MATKVKPKTLVKSKLMEKTANVDFKAYIDGGSRGNPGPAGWGVYIETYNQDIWGYLGVQTNNYAEYSALVQALTYASEQQCENVEIISDSELVVKQIKGEYAVRNENILPLWREAKNLIEKFDSFTIRHVRREFNKRADANANRGMDQETKIPPPEDAEDAEDAPPPTKSESRTPNLIKFIKEYMFGSNLGLPAHAQDEWARNIAKLMIADYKNEKYTISGLLLTYSPFPTFLDYAVVKKEIRTFNIDIVAELRNILENP